MSAISYLRIDSDPFVLQLQENFIFNALLEVDN